MQDQLHRGIQEVEVGRLDADMCSYEEDTNSASDSEAEFPTKLMGFQKASLHRPEDFAKLDKKV